MSTEQPSTEINREEQIESCLDFLTKEIYNLDNPTLIGMCLEIIEDKKFQECPAAKNRHQAYKGGLVVHTSEVLETSLLMTESTHLEVDRDILVTAIIFHDMGKVYDYYIKEDGTYDYTSHQNKIRHLARSYAEFMISANTNKLDSELTDRIGHVILAHHGRKEWGSPVEPMTAEAHIIHYADMLSAQVSKDYYVR